MGQWSSDVEPDVHAIGQLIFGGQLIDLRTTGASGS
jgi:hypothetical protein